MLGLELNKKIIYFIQLRLFSLTIINNTININKYCDKNLYFINCVG